MSGRKTFTAGEVLTAADVNGYLMDQSVMVFAGTAARASAIPSPSEGMVTYRTDDNAVEAYDGSAWAAISGGGKILQIVAATYSTAVSTNSNTYIDTGLTATITPSSTNSKVLIIINQNGVGKYSGNTYASLRVLRNATSLSDWETRAGRTAAAGDSYIGSSSFVYLDSPATISAVSYKTQIASGAAVTGVEAQSASSVSSIILMEVAA